MDQVSGPSSNSNNCSEVKIEEMHETLHIISSNGNSINNEGHRIKRIKLDTSTSLGQGVDNKMMVMPVSKDNNKDSSFQQAFEFQINVYKDGGAEPFFISERALINYPAFLEFFKYHGQDFNKICQKSVNSSGYSGNIESQSEKEESQKVMVRSEKPGIANLIDTPISLPILSSVSKSDTTKEPAGLHLRSGKIVAGASDGIVFKSTSKTRRICKKVDPKKFNVTNCEGYKNCDLPPKESTPPTVKYHSEEPKNETAPDTKEMFISSEIEEFELATDDCLTKGWSQPEERSPTKDPINETTTSSTKEMFISSEIEEFELATDDFLTKGWSLLSPKASPQLEERSPTKDPINETTSNTQEMFLSSELEELELATDDLKGWSLLSPKASPQSEERSPTKDPINETTTSNTQEMFLSSEIEEFELATDDCLTKGWSLLSPKASPQPEESSPTKDPINETTTSNTQEMFLSSEIEEFELATDDCLTKGWSLLSPKASPQPEERFPTKDPINETTTSSTKELAELASSSRAPPPDTRFANLLDVLRSTYASLPAPAPMITTPSSPPPAEGPHDETDTIEPVADNLTGLEEDIKEPTDSSSVSVPTPTAVNVNINSTGLGEAIDDSSDSEIEILGQGRADLVTDSEDEEPEPGSPEILKVPNYDYDTSDDSDE